MERKKPFWMNKDDAKELFDILRNGLMELTSDKPEHVKKRKEMEAAYNKRKEEEEKKEKMKMMRMRNKTLKLESSKGPYEDKEKKKKEKKKKNQPPGESVQLASSKNEPHFVL